MIARIWHGTTEAAKADDYVEYLNKTGIPDYRATRGNNGAYILRNIEGGTAHFYTLTFWDCTSEILPGRRKVFARIRVDRPTFRGFRLKLKDRLRQSSIGVL